MSKSSIIFFRRVEFSVCPKQSNLLRAQVINITAKGRKEALYSRLSPENPKVVWRRWWRRGNCFGTVLWGRPGTGPLLPRLQQFYPTSTLRVTRKKKEFAAENVWKGHMFTIVIKDVQLSQKHSPIRNFSMLFYDYYYSECSLEEVVATGKEKKYSKKTGGLLPGNKTIKNRRQNIVSGTALWCDVSQAENISLLVFGTVQDEDGCMWRFFKE